ncbi:MAG: hypothetical protein WBQ84_12155, partial [Methylocella sp.]
MDRGSCFAGFGLEFARLSKSKEAVSGRIEKICLPPTGGCAPALSSPQFRRDWAEQPVATYFDTDADCRKLLVAIATGGFEVLVNHALYSIQLTNKFLRFPRVR